MKEKRETKERRVIIPNEAGLAVVKGAAIFGHTLNNVTDRVVRYDYGIKKRTTFDPTKNPEKNTKKINKYGSAKARKTFKKFIKRNTSVKEGTVLKDKGHKDPFSDHVFLEVYAASRDVLFVDGEGCIELCAIRLCKKELKPYKGKKTGLSISVYFWSH